MTTKESIIHMIDDTNLFRDLENAEAFVVNNESGLHFDYLDDAITKDSIIWDVEDAKNDKEANEAFDGVALNIFGVDISFRDLLNAKCNEYGEFVFPKDPSKNIHRDICVRFLQVVPISINQYQ